MIQEKPENLNISVLGSKIITLKQFVLQSLGNDYTAYLCWLIGVIFWQIGFIYLNENKIESYQSGLSRGVILLVYNYIRLRFNGSQCYTGKYLLKLNIRHIIIVLHGLIFAQLQFYLPLSLIYTIYCSGSFFILVMDYFINHITINQAQLKGCIVVFLGLLLTINGQFVLSWLFNPDYQFSNSALLRTILSFFLCFITFFWAYSIIIVKQLKNMPHCQINFHLGIVLIIIAAFFYPLKSQRNIQQSNLSIYFKSMLFHGIPLAITQQLFMIALQLTKNTGIVTMIGQLSIVMSYSISIIRYNENINFVCIFGSLCIIGGIWFIIKKN